MTTWFKELTGFEEDSPEQVRQQMTLAGETLTSHVNGHQMHWGSLEIPTLGDLRQSIQSIPSSAKPNTLAERVADIQALHRDPANQQAVFQVASQFNLLEMISPEVTPESGISRYESDLTQGPACAVAAGAGTIYRNYFVPIQEQRGQTANAQIDCLSDIGVALGNTGDRLWRMKNGYALPTAQGLKDINQQLAAMSPDERDALRQKLRIGIQWNTEVTIAKTRHRVTQAYCSALPVAYCAITPQHWEPFARLILEASYEATFCTAILNADRTGNHQLFLTLLGGGAFGNAKPWIFDAIKRSLKLYANAGLDIKIVSFRASNLDLVKFIAEIVSTG